MIAFSALSNAAAVSGASSGLCVFDLEWPWDPSCWLPHPGAACALEWHPHVQHARVLAVAGVRGTLSIYDLSQGQGLPSALATRRQLGGAADSLQWSCAHAHVLAARDMSGSIALWDVRVGETASGHGIVRFGSELPLGHDGASAVASLDDLATPVDMSTTHNRGSLSWGTGSRENELVSSQGGSLRVWDLRRLAEPVFHVREAHTGSVLSLSWRGDGCSGSGCGHGPTPNLVSCGTDGLVRLWQIGPLPYVADTAARVESASSEEACSSGMAHCISSVQSRTGVQHACCMSGNGCSGDAEMVVAVTVCEPAEAAGSGSNARGAVWEPGTATNGLQLWRLGADGTSLHAMDWVPAGRVRRVVCSAGSVLAGCEAAHASSLLSDDQSGPNEAELACLPLASIGSDHCLRLWSVHPSSGTTNLHAQVGSGSNASDALSSEPDASVDAWHGLQSDSTSIAASTPSGEVTAASADGHDKPHNLWVASLSRQWEDFQPTHLPSLHVTHGWLPDEPRGAGLSWPSIDADARAKAFEVHLLCRILLPVSPPSEAPQLTTTSPHGASSVQDVSMHWIRIGLWLPSLGLQPPSATARAYLTLEETGMRGSTEALAEGEREPRPHLLWRASLS